MSQPPTNPNPRLSQLIEDAVADVDPVDRLAAIRARTANASESKVTTMTSRRRSWTLTAGAAVVAAAAVVVAVAVIGQQDNKPTSGPGPAASDSTSDGSSSSPAPSDPTSATSSTDGGGSSVYAMYFVGDTPFGPRLYREFQPVEGGDAATTVLAMAIGGDALDPDYRSLWPEGTTVEQVTDNGDVVTVDLGSHSQSLRERPTTMSKQDASIAVQQVIFTAQAFFGRGRAPVQLLIDGQHSDMVLGVPASEPLANDDPNDVLSLVSLTDPAEGDVVTGGTLHVSGVANSFEATVPWQILQGATVVDEYSFMAEGAYDKLYPFEGTIDVSGLAPGTYTLRVATDDPSGGEGPGPYVDTRTFTIG